MEGMAISGGGAMLGRLFVYPFLRPALCWFDRGLAGRVAVGYRLLPAQSKNRLLKCTTPEIRDAMQMEGRN